MKKLFTVSLLMSLILAAKAQSGTVLVGGDVGFTSSKNNSGVYEYKVQSLSFNPYVGYQFNNNWTAGVVAGIASSKQG